MSQRYRICVFPYLKPFSAARQPNNAYNASCFLTTFRHYKGISVNCSFAAPHWNALETQKCTAFLIETTFTTWHVDSCIAYPEWSNKNIIAFGNAIFLLAYSLSIPETYLKQDMVFPAFVKLKTIYIFISGFHSLLAARVRQWPQRFWFGLIPAVSNLLTCVLTPRLNF